MSKLVYLNHIEKHYGISAFIGQRVTVDGMPGIIVEDMCNYLGVNFDDDKPNVIKKCHPTWKVKYMGVAIIRKLTRSQQRYADYLKADTSLSFRDYMGFKNKRRIK